MWSWRCQPSIYEFLRRRRERRKHKRFYAEPVHTLASLVGNDNTRFVSLLVDLLETDVCDSSTTARIVHAALELMITKGNLGLLREMLRRIPSLSWTIMDRLMDRIQPYANPNQNPTPAATFAGCLLNQLPHQIIDILPNVQDALLRHPVPYTHAQRRRGRFTWTLYFFRDFQDLASVKQALRTRTIQTRLCEMDKLMYPIVVVNHCVACTRAKFIYGVDSVTRGDMRTRCGCRFQICALGMKLNGPV
ncbi:hypothetical protein HK102_005923 [Quaeritorhiza haematococci]|nr:hypothetical protein HK102_005923 [Quaeritorhiza haematococci]